MRRSIVPHFRNEGVGPMDGKQFDDIIRSFGYRTTRRTTLKGFGLGVLGAAGLMRGARAQSECPEITDTGQGTNPPLCDGGFRVNEGDSGTRTVTIGDCSCDIEYAISSDGKSFSFSSTSCTVGSIVVKGGNEGARIYDYSSCGGVKSASGLQTPTGQEISHVDLCGITCCVAKTCTDLGYECGEQTDNCGGPLDCGTCTCPPDSLSNDDSRYVCTSAGKCVCTPLTAQEACGTECGGTEPDGCCGLVNCAACPQGGCDSCTIGYYRQNQCNWDTNANLPCGPNTAIYQKCNEKYGKKITKLLTAKGQDVICAQAAAAFLNQRLSGSCTADLDICNATNAELTAANEGFGDENCPLKGCGRAKAGTRKQRKVRRNR
jgi:hypothetical protein